jgi:dipeptidyl-peptidase-4
MNHGRETQARLTSAISVFLLAATSLTVPSAAASNQEFQPDYERAAKFSMMALMPLVLNGMPAASWIGDEDVFWIKIQNKGGHQFMMVDAATGEQKPAFDHSALANALTAAGQEDVKAEALPILGLRFEEDSIVVQLAGAMYRCDASATECEPAGSGPDPTALPSPDGTKTVFIRDHNLWLRDGEGAETQLTHAGSEFFAYGSPNIFDNQRVTRRRTGSPRPIGGVVWSPDSRYVAAFRTDRRDMPLRPYVTEHVPPDDLFAIVHMDRQLVAGDNINPRRVVEIIDTSSGAIVEAQVASAGLQDFAEAHFTAGSVWWDLDDGKVFFDGGTRDGTTYAIFETDLTTGRSRTVVEETQEHYYQFNPSDYAQPNFHVTADGDEAIWYSQRSGFGHLYLYDARTGKLKNAITAGDWEVFDLIRVDETNRVIYFTAGGRERGRNPYYRHLYHVGFDGGEPRLLTPEDADHEFTQPATYYAGVFAGSSSSLSPSGRFFVDTSSTLDQPPVMIIRTNDGEKVATVLEADASALLATGWRPPKRFVVKAADGTTDLYGAMYTPLEMEPGMKYAVVEHTYPGPQGDFGPHGFMEGIGIFLGNNLQRTAELGFIGITLDGRGTSSRSRAFRYAFAGTEDVYGSVDHKVAIQNLAKKYDFIDAERVGITGASFGGYGTVRAMLLHPDFFDVVVSHVGPHDFRHLGPALTVDRFFGIPSTTDPEHDFYTVISNTRLVDRLKGHLLLVYGEIDENVPFVSPMIMYDALIKADKNFDTFIIPNSPHGTTAHPYAMRRQLEYFVEHLGGPVPAGE